MNYHLGRNGQQLGQFSEEVLQQGLKSGEFLPSDLVWTDGMSDWLPLSQVLPPPVEEKETSSAVEAEATILPPVPPPVQKSPSVSVNLPYYPTSAPVHEAVGVMPTPGTAIASLVLGIASIVTCVFILAIPGVICGHLALSRIKESQGRYGGRGLAITGLVIGYLWLALIIICLLFFALVFGFAAAQDPDMFKTP